MPKMFTYGKITIFGIFLNVKFCAVFFFKLQLWQFLKFKCQFSVWSGVDLEVVAAISLW